MIELNNITRIYKPKRGVEVKALNSVSVKFQDKGMVFVLGKSGSGKSTLLNIIGGLDKYDEGDLLIQGKTTQDFKQSDFDSYRNTMIGFIFQEYNVLDEFTVAQNIGLALQLQGKKMTSEAINEILDSVDLTGFGDRKPNELSGGQKQRVAIARALVKDPKIIMADEPTGALDSDTGKQVFETLKKLSQEKLVIIVSHDRDFAEKYGSRVIEFKDGDIIRDVTKVSLDQDEIKPLILDSEGIRIAAGYQLTPNDVSVINSYLAKSKSEVKAITHIENNQGTKASSFVQTDMNKIKSSDEEYAAIKSRLPFKASLKMGASALKHKRIRLVFSIILASISLVLFGLADTMGSYNKETATLKSMRDSNVNYLAFEKNFISKRSDGLVINNQDIEQNDIEKLNKINNKVQFKPIVNFGEYNRLRYSAYQSYGSYSNNGMINSSGELSGFAQLNEQEISNYGFSLTGKLPVKSNEVVLPSIAFEVFKKYGYENPTDNSRVTINNESDLIGKKLDINTNEQSYKFTIVGVVDTKLDFERYNKSNLVNISYYLLYNELSTLLHYTYHGALFVSDSFLNDHFVNVRYNGQDVNISTYNENFKNIKYVDGFSEKDIRDNQVVIPYNKIYKYNLEQYIRQQLRDSYNDKEKFDKIIKEVEEKHGKKPEYTSDSWYIEKYIEILGDFDDLENPYIYKALEERLRNMDDSVDYKPVKVIGVTTDNNEKVIVSSDMFKLFESKQAKKIISIVGYFNDLSDQELLDFIKLNYIDNGVAYKLKNQVMATLEDLNSTIEVAAKGFIYVGIGFSVFASLLMLNFISASVANKKKEIGILRAIGARGKDVLSIFSKEALIIALINYVLAMIGVIIAISWFNSMLREEYDILITILNLGIRQFALVLLVSVTVAFIAAAIPVLSIARKRPIDAIRDK
ncbi:ABC transporter, permease/ATP-binding protein [Alteracholeplasma palmae J233]|uniref:ABC transporter, permease/ATP-binding protein n=1 Tax=Alteracholeplasma palmae (strain ATCC 49389 / J233) TaxID=1318466 RepID=U4KN89_ALTPJ|nr:ATP-binding cassette domain-containing protein [Alteracholeplasma palmae]CCV63640.1 ABC transporter, permease/ATP-binding protein [Alteracholeplasma palmae J233]